MSRLEKKTDKYLTQQHKLHWHLDRVSDWSKGKSIVPLYIDMGITQTCNIHCQYCYYATPENRTTKIITTEKDFFRIKRSGIRNLNYVSVDLKIINDKSFVKELLKNL